MTETAKPRAKGDMKCPLWRRPMKQVCHTCEWWTHVRGKHPQGEEVIDAWGCAISWLPLLTIENSQQQRQTAASVDKFASVVDRAAVESVALRAELVSKAVRLMSGPTQDREQIADARDNHSAR